MVKTSFSGIKLYLIWNKLIFRLDEEYDAMAIEFFVHLCGDVLLEIFRSGNRRQLVKLERVGWSFLRLVENFLRERPFLRLNLEIDSRLVFLISTKIQK